MTPGNQAIVGGTALRIPAIQSPNYNPGASGWIINIDGSSEFNSGTFRGSIEVGPITGQHFIVNNTSTGDIIDAYDSSNRLVFRLDQFGNITQISYGSVGTTVGISQGGIQFFDNNDVTPVHTPGIFFDPSTGTYRLFIGSGTNVASGFEAQLVAEGESSNNAQNNGLVGVQRGNHVGYLVQNDSPEGNPTNNLIHCASYTGTVGANGVWSFAHGCSFTPTGFIISPWDSAGVQSRYYPNIGSSVIIGANAQTQWWDGVGNRVANGTAVGAMAIFFG